MKTISPLSHTLLLSALAFGMAPVEAANWLMLQGTEPAGSAERAHVWGFIQPEYQFTDGTELKAGPWSGQDAAFNQIGPDLDSASTFNLRRARLGVRGTALPIDSKINYFLLAELGNNIITSEGSGFAALSDASVTLNYIPGARLRVGQFKYPGSEEGMQAIHTFDYINFTNASNYLLLERFFDKDGSVASATDANKMNGSGGAFRDIGLQLFDSFQVGEWDHSYAVMVGNGNGLNRNDNNDAKDLYLYWSSEWIFGGQGPRREGLKLFSWYQDGERTLRAGPTQTKQDFDRTRWGLGGTFRKGPYRVTGEYIAADGMIFAGTDGGAVPGSLNNAGTSVAGFNVETEEKGDGWYLDLGYRVLPDVELNLRYDRLNRGTEVAANERQFETWTLGGQYFFNKKVRLIANYEMRSAEAPGLPASHAANQILDNMDDRFSLQVLAIF